jgi:hypothetical protein
MSVSISSVLYLITIGLKQSWFNVISYCSYYKYMNQTIPNILLNDKIPFPTYYHLWIIPFVTFEIRRPVSYHF